MVCSRRMPDTHIAGGEADPLQSDARCYHARGSSVDEGESVVGQAFSPSISRWHCQSPGWIVRCLLDAAGELACGFRQEITVQCGRRLPTCDCISFRELMLPTSPLLSLGANKSCRKSGMDGIRLLKSYCLGWTQGSADGVDVGDF